MTAKVSIIVPIYNSEKYLLHCLSYIVNQSLKEIEVILVNDGSTDKSIDIIRACQAQFPQIVKVISLEKNQGVGHARNEGIQAATGEYIGFVDSDDQIDVTMYEKLYKEAKAGDYEVVECAYYNESTGKSRIIFDKAWSGELQDEGRRKLVATTGYTVNKIYKREFLKKHDITFRENGIYEDIDFLMLVYLNVKRISCVNEILYLYRNTEQSTSKKADLDKSHENMRLLLYALYERVISKSEYEEYWEEARYQYLYHYGVILKSLEVQSADRVSFNVNERRAELAELTRKAAPKYYENKYLNEYIEKDRIVLMKKNEKN